MVNERRYEHGSRNNFSIISRFSRERADFSEWLLDTQEPIFLFTLDSVVPSYRGTNIKAFGFPTMADGRLEVTLSELHADQGFRVLIALEEGEILRVGAIRSALNVPGQSHESAWAFRHKPTMKQILSGAGIPVAPYLRHWLARLLRKIFVGNLDFLWWSSRRWECHPRKHGLFDRMRVFKSGWLKTPVTT